MKLRSMTVTAAMSNQCEAGDGITKGGQKTIVRADTGLSSGSETSVVSCNFQGTKGFTNPDNSSSNQDNQSGWPGEKDWETEPSVEGSAVDPVIKSKKIKNKRKQHDSIYILNSPAAKAAEKPSNEKTVTVNESTDIPEIIIDDISPRCSKTTETGARKRKSLNESIIVLGEENLQEPPVKKRHIQNSSASSKDTSCEVIDVCDVINLCDDDVSIVEVNHTPSLAEDIIYLDSNRNADQKSTPYQKSSVLLRGRRRKKTCTVLSSSPKYESFLKMVRPSVSSVVTDNTVSSTSTENSFTVDRNGWQHLKQQLRHKNNNGQRFNQTNRIPDNCSNPADGSNPIGSNIYNPNPQAPKPSGALRPVIIDGSNVAVGHSRGTRKFSCRGLQICIDYFAKRGHEVKAFVPQFRKHDTYQVTDGHIFEELEKAGHIVFTPSRRIDGKLRVPYDDRYIVQYAAEVEGVIVSTDNFRDLLHENPAWRDTIENRLLMFTWVGDLLMFPMDPLGRHGPKLDEFLRFPQ